MVFSSVGRGDGSIRFSASHPTGGARQRGVTSRFTRKFWRISLDSAMILPTGVASASKTQTPEREQDMASEYSRREMLRLAAVSAGAAALSGITIAEEAKKKIPIGLELYSVRNELAREFEPIIAQVGKMGYEGVEFAGYY